jgi:hypothetical protein
MNLKLTCKSSTRFFACIVGMALIVCFATNYTNIATPTEQILGMAIGFFMSTWGLDPE